jgi:CRP/FNR family transcriptional regulator, cyclic AMP receptor protein
MTEKKQLINQNKIVDNYKSLIASYPLFSLLSHEDVIELTQIAKEKILDPDVTITNQGDIVDSVYLIVSGTAEVTRTITNIEKQKVMHIATLAKGDAIGLADTGFFSHKGIRTATVITSSPSILLEFKLIDFQKFLQRPGMTYPGLKNAGDKILLMSFIRNSTLFNHYSSDQIHHLANRLRKIVVNADSVIFSEGDEISKYYYIVEGNVSVTSSENRAKKNIYESHSLLAENDYINGEKHKSTACSLTKCELFVFDRDNIRTIEHDFTKRNLFRKLFAHVKKLKVR